MTGPFPARATPCTGGKQSEAGGAPWRWSLVLAVWLAALMVYVHQEQFLSPTPVSRLDALHALWNTKALAIDRYERNTPDKAEYDGHFFSDKAPGMLVLAWPGFAISGWLGERCGVPVESERGWLLTSWSACALSGGLLGALGGVCLWKWLSRRVSPRSAFITVLALFLGAAPLPYATMLFSHTQVVGLLAIALWAVDRCLDADQAVSLGAAPHAGVVARGGSGWQQMIWRHRWELIGGHACGWALCSEYTSGLVVVGLLVLLVWLAPPAPRWGRALAFVLAAVPPLLLIPIYSYACYGLPWVLPYSLQASFPEMRKGLYAIQWPHFPTAWRLLADPAKGLLVWTPFLVLALPGWWWLLQRRDRIFLLVYTIPVAHWIIISGRVWDWKAGPTLGPRYLAPLLPLLALPCALAVERWPRAGSFLATLSIALTSLATLTDACPGYGVDRPLVELHLPRLLEMRLSHNLGSLLGLPPFVSLILYPVVLGLGAYWLWTRLPEPAQSKHPA